MDDSHGLRKMVGMMWFALAVDLTAIFVLSYVLYFRRHGRRDLVLAYVALNVGIFSVVAMLTTKEVGVAVGFGLFGVLSILRLRSDTISQGEIGYYFTAIALGLINAVAAPAPWTMLGLNTLMLGVMYVADHPGLLSRSQRTVLTLDVVHEDEGDLRQELERRLRGQVQHVLVQEVDYVRDLMVLDVRYHEPRSTPATPPVGHSLSFSLPAWLGGR